MPTAKATKASDKALICRKLVTALQKLYGKSVPRIDMPVLETLLFAICLEDNAWSNAEAGYKKLISSYFDLNEIRVSSVSELEQTLQPLRDSDWKGLRIRGLLRHVFESTYSFEFEKFRRLTQEVAVKTLKKITDLTPFVKDFAQQQILGSHIVCLDNSMLVASQWLGLVPADSDLAAAGEFLKAGLKKSEVAEFCHFLRCLATDPKFRDRFAEPPDGELDMTDVFERLQEVQLPPKKKPVKPPEKPSDVTPVKGAKPSEKAAAKESGAKSSTAPRSVPATSPGKSAPAKDAAKTPPPKSAKPTATSKNTAKVEPTDSGRSGKAGKPSEKASPSHSTKGKSSSATKSAPGKGSARSDDKKPGPRK